MNGLAERTGFTLLELLAAVVLLGLLSTVLTMLFRQGSISWSVGETAVVDVSCRRHEIARAARDASDALTCVDVGGNRSVIRMCSPWTSEGDIRDTRPFVCADAPSSHGSAFCVISLSAGQAASSEAVEIIVTSAGPDGKWGTDDDLTTDPLEGVE